jgi:AAA domain/CHC2 zinc finger
MTPAFHEWVERAKAGNIGAILAARNIVLKGRHGQLAGPCPNCGGTDRFAVDLNRQIFNCRGCGASGGGVINFVRFLDGVGFIPACEIITGEKRPDDSLKVYTSKPRPKRGTFVCAYSYHDAFETERYQVVRYADPKSFSQRRPDPARPGAWIENLQGVDLVPYRLPELIEAIATGFTIYLVEGEKDVEAARGLGLVATTTAMGIAGRGHWERGIYDNYFAGADVVLVPDQDADDNKGRALAQVIGKRLKPVAARVRILTLPAKDLSAWIDQGGTREAFDHLTPEDLVTNGHDHAPPDWEPAPDWEPPPEPHTAAAAGPVAVIYPLPIVGEDIPRRQWIVPTLLLRRCVSVMVAPPGSGKSLLTLQLGLMMASGHPWGGWRPRGAVRTLIINSEDDADEMRRRLYAGIRVMQLDEIAMLDRIALADAPETIVIAKADSKTKTVIAQPMAQRIVATIIEGGFDVVIVDPFAETFEGDENSNSELKWAAVLWREIARKTNCAILLVHHTRKYGAEAGDMDAARGAGALIGVARVVSTVFTMSEKEAELFAKQTEGCEKPEDRFNAERRHEYLRFDDAKANLTLITSIAKWFHKRTYVLPNGTDTEPPDEVGALVEWKPKTIFDRIPPAIARAILHAIDTGVLDKEGQPTGDLFTMGKQGGGKRWAGDIIKATIECEDKEARTVLATWHANGVITEVERETSTSRGQKRKGLKVNMTKMPGTEITS